MRYKLEQAGKIIMVHRVQRSRGSKSTISIEYDVIGNPLLTEKETIH